MHDPGRNRRVWGRIVGLIGAGAAFLLLAGCTALDATGQPLPDVGTQVLTFIEDFARQALAAYLL